MKVEHIPCGPFASQSEEIAIKELKKKLQGLTAEGSWVLLTNLAHSSRQNIASDEIDLIAIGTPKVQIIEIKHWDAQYLKLNVATVESEAEKLNNKVKRVASKLRQLINVGFIQGKVLLTKGDYKGVKSQQRQTIRGIEFLGLKEWRELLDIDSPKTLDEAKIQLICKYLEPRTKVSLTGDIRNLAGITDLKRLFPESDRFHRIYKGSHSRLRDPLILHLYDLSAYEVKKPEEVASREFDTLQRLQKSPWVPRVMDSFQDAPEYPGELYYFSIVDPASATLLDWAKNEQWLINERLQTAALCIQALAEFHKPDDDDSEPILHRNITPESLRVRSNGKPLFTQFNLAKLSNATTVASAPHSFARQEDYVAPEILQSGLSAADIRSDIYALCSTLRILFEDRPEPEANFALELLEKGRANYPNDRITIEELRANFLDLTDDKQLVTPSNPPAQFWDEYTEVTFKDEYYKIISKLGSGGFGTTFKVLHCDKDTKEDLGTYVAKVIHTPEVGQVALKAYSKARSYVTHPNLSVIFETAPKWEENQFMALMKWIEGHPLSDLSGVLEIYWEDLGDNSCEGLVLRWLQELCDALAALHQVGLVHGDISPRNIIVSGSEVTITDYDFVTENGSKTIGRGTTTFCAPNVQNGSTVACSDDIFALAATFFYVLFDKEPFRFDGVFAKERGLNWKDIDRDKWERLASFLDKATDPDSNKRFSSAIEARSFLRSLANDSPTTNVKPVDSDIQQPPLTSNEVPWLLELLCSYPGSRHGNAETRGLDSDFAEKTYVETRLEQALLEEIQGRKVSLVILCGNAGDGKTAFLQHLATRLGLPKPVSAERFWNHTLPGDLKVRANLDGSASHKNRTATQILNEFFDPFHSGESPTNLVHLVAINSGKLLEWIEDYENLHQSTSLTEQLWEALAGNDKALASHIRFIDLNVRSLVGGIPPNLTEISTNFLDELIEKFLDGTEGQKTWEACQTCTAQSRCTVWNSVRSLRSEIGSRIKNRLYSALQAVHQRGEVHITARELRAALSYIFFGVDSCKDLHDNPERIPLLYYDRAFMATSVNRQGEVLHELTYLDPALETHPLIDRYLMTQENQKSLSSARRRAYFEWTDEQIKSVGLNEVALGLARGKHLSTFLKVATMTEEERAKVCADLCRGISKLEDLPSIILNRHDVVPLKISPRTPTESVFWVEKPIERFKLFLERFSNIKGLETLHSYLVLQYKYADERVEKLILGTELFHILMELKDGYQVSDSLSDDIFTNLSIFTQRLAQEDDRVLYAWNPIEEETVFEVKIVFEDGVQKLVLQHPSIEVTK